MIEDVIGMTLYAVCIGSMEFAFAYISDETNERATYELSAGVLEQDELYMRIIGELVDNNCAVLKTLRPAGPCCGVSVKSAGRSATRDRKKIETECHESVQRAITSSAARTSNGFD